MLNNLVSADRKRISTGIRWKISERLRDKEIVISGDALARGRELGTGSAAMSTACTK